MPWFYIQNEQRIGPVEESELFRLARAGKLSPNDLVWNPALGQEWKPASSIPGLFASPPATASAIPAGTTPNRDLMLKALGSLRGRWTVAVGATLLYGLITNLFNIASEFGSPAWKGAATGLHILIALFISGPMLLGWNRIFQQIARGAGPDLDRLFDGFRMYGKSIGVSWLLGLYIFLSLVPFILVVLGGSFAWIRLGTSNSSAFMTGFLLILCIPALIPSVLVALNYSLIFFILSDHPDLPVTDVLAHSRKLMYGFRWKYACLGARFIGWVILAIFTCGIGFLWLQPYIVTSNAHFYDDIRSGA